MTTWPNFFIVGAPRCGTTALFLHLARHQDIFLPTVKEPHFFATIEPNPKVDIFNVKGVARFRDEVNYLELFKAAGDKLAVGEASVGYLYDESAPNRIYQKIPNAKIIILLRDPVQRTYSNYLHVSVAGNDELTQKSFYEALIEDQARPNKTIGQAHLFVDSSLYYDSVKRYLDIFGSDSVRIYLYEDFVSDPSKLIRDVCTFLNVPFYDGSFFEPDRRYNYSGTPRSRIVGRLWSSRGGQWLERWLIAKGLPPAMRLILRRLLLRADTAPPIDRRAKELLKPIFRDDILNLQRLIGKDLSNWLMDNEAGR